MIKALVGLTGVSLLATLLMWLAMGKAQAKAETATLAKLTAQASLAEAEAENAKLGDRLVDIQEQHRLRLEAERQIAEERWLSALAQRRELNETKRKMAELLQEDECFAVPYPDGVVGELRVRADRANGVRGGTRGPVDPGTNDPD